MVLYRNPSPPGVKVSINKFTSNKKHKYFYVLLERLFLLTNQVFFFSRIHSRDFLRKVRHTLSLLCVLAWLYRGPLKSTLRLKFQGHHKCCSSAETRWILRRISRLSTSDRHICHHVQFYIKKLLVFGIQSDREFGQLVGGGRSGPSIVLARLRTEHLGTRSLVRASRWRRRRQEAHAEPTQQSMSRTFLLN